MVLEGKYRILKALGKGAEGSVWLAVHVQTEQLWAVKEIPRKVDGREFHELEMMKKLQHPSLPKVLDVLETEAYLYLIMEYIRGYTLEEIKQKKGRLTPRQVLEVGEQLSDALTYLHGRKQPVFHLDIKPANIIQKKDGRLVLVDFGAARKDRTESEAERRGTDGFAAPEQYDLEASLDGRADIFGLGATMYYLISGVKYSLPLWKSRVPGCPEYLNTMIRTCLQKSPEKRYQNSKQLQGELARQKKKIQRGRWRCKFWTALLMVILAMGAAVRELPAEFAAHMEENWNYEKLLEEALCVSGEKSLEYYRQALFLEPSRREAYLQYLDSADNDGVFSQEEEEALRVMIYTIPLGQTETYEEILAKNSASYGEVAYQIGMTYWFYYKSEDGKRIAGGWFAKARDVLDGLPENRRKEEWETRAEVFAHMSTYFQQLGQEDQTGEANLAETYWRDFVRILKLKEKEAPLDVLELQFLKEAMGQMIFLTEELWQEGISIGELKETMGYVMERMSVTETENGDKELVKNLKVEILEQAETALAVVEHLER